MPLYLLLQVCLALPSLENTAHQKLNSPQGGSFLIGTKTKPAGFLQQIQIVFRLGTDYRRSHESRDHLVSLQNKLLNTRPRDFPDFSKIRKSLQINLFLLLSSGLFSQKRLIFQPQKRLIFQAKVSHVTYVSYISTIFSKNILFSRLLFCGDCLHVLTFPFCFLSLPLAQLCSPEGELVKAFFAMEGRRRRRARVPKQSFAGVLGSSKKKRNTRR